MDVAGVVFGILIGVGVVAASGIWPVLVAAAVVGGLGYAGYRIGRRIWKESKIRELNAERKARIGEPGDRGVPFERKERRELPPIDPASRLPHRRMTRHDSVFGKKHTYLIRDEDTVRGHYENLRADLENGDRHQARAFKNIERVRNAMGDARPYQPLNVEMQEQQPRQEGNENDPLLAQDGSASADFQGRHNGGGNSF